jgi:CO/xanthine dehydrogenase Mo-binding subunit
LNKDTHSHTKLEIGTSHPRGDAADKAAGREKYAADHYPENLVWAGAVRAGNAHGRLLSVDVSEAMALPGVITVLTAKDVKGSNRQGIIHKDMPVLVDDRILYCGDPVALVVAETKDVLARAISLVRFQTETLPAVFDPESAMAENAPILHEAMPGNFLMQAEIRKGDAEREFAACDAVVEGEFSTPVQAHGFLETENGVAWQESDGTIAMIASTQAPFRDRFEIGMAVGLPFGSIRMISPALGGGFGGKDGATVQCLLALAALHTGGRPVKMQWEREENMLAGYKRHACRMHYKLGAKQDGTLHAIHCSLVYDTGAYAHLGGEVMELGMEHAAGPYRIPHALIEGKCVLTNNPVGGAMRAFGVCQATFAFESMMDMLADRLGLDRLAIRQINALVEGDENCAGVRLITSTGIAGCLDILGDHPLWRSAENWKRECPPGMKRGVGLASVFNAAGYGGKVRDSAIAKVELSVDGRIIVHNAVSDMGQGNSCAFSQIAGHMLGQSPEFIELRQPDTATAYPSGSSSAGRTTYTFGNALIKACEDMKARLINRAGLLLFIDNDRDLVLEPGKVTHAPSNREVPLSHLASFMPYEDRVCIGQFVAPVCEDIPDTAQGFFIGFPHIIFAYGAHLVRIELDTTTGVITVCDYLATTDGGGIINPSMFDQQIQGGVAQGLGYAMMEDFITKEGKPLTKDFTGYLIPGSLDLPDTISIPYLGHEPTGPFGLKGVGEVALNGPMPAIANAVHDACGVRIFSGPITAEKVLAAMHGC